MKKALLAVSIAMMCAGASAQSFVKVYGRVNLSLEHQKDGPTDSNQMRDNSSRWGLLGEEDLGAGMKAFFQLENGFDASTGAAANAKSSWSRESFVGLSTNYGAIRAGQFTSPLYLASADYVSMHNHDTGTSSDALFAYDIAGATMKNAWSYKTPDFSGLNVELAGNTAEDVAGAGGALNLSVNYDKGPLHLGGGFGRLKPLAATEESQLFVIRGLYEFGALTVGGYFEYDDIQSKRRTNVRLAAMYAIGNHEIHGNVGVASDIEGQSNTGARQGTVGYNYNLSKRTKVYSFFTLVQNDDNATYNVSVAGKTYRSLAVGVRHNF